MYKKYPDLADVVLDRMLPFNSLTSIRRYTEEICALIEVIHFDAPEFEVINKWSDKRYNNMIKRLRKYIMSNPDMIIFALL